MKRAILLGSAFAVSLCVSGLPLLAQMGGGGGMGQGGNLNPPAVSGNINRGDLERTGMQNGPNSGMKHPHKTLAQQLEANAKLSKTLQDLLPAGEKVQDAVSGFDNLEEFAAAVHISHNLKIPFDQFKAKVKKGDNLNKAVRTLNPKLSHKEVKSEVKKGKKQAKADIKASRHS